MPVLVKQVKRTFSDYTGIRSNPQDTQPTSATASARITTRCRSVRLSVSPNSTQ
jgi:hypothetical protein